MVVLRMAGSLDRAKARVALANPLTILNHLYEIGGHGPQFAPLPFELVAEDSARAGQQLGRIQQMGESLWMHQNRAAELRRPTPGGASVVQVNVREQHPRNPVRFQPEPPDFREAVLERR